MNQFFMGCGSLMGKNQFFYVEILELPIGGKDVFKQVK